MALNFEGDCIEFAALFFSKGAIFTILVLRSMNMGGPFCVFNFFFLCCRVLKSLVTFISWHFADICLRLLQMGIVSMVAFQQVCLVVIRKASHFYLLVLNTATLLKMCITLESLLVDSFKNKFVSPANANLTFFPIHKLLFCYLGQLIFF